MASDTLIIESVLTQFEHDITRYGVAYGPDRTRYMVTMTGDQWELEVTSPDHRTRDRLLHGPTGAPFPTMLHVQRHAIRLARRRARMGAHYA